MIEEIKKEMSTVLKPYKDCHINHCFPKIFEILNKYDNQPDYKGAWDELKETLSNYFDLPFADTYVQVYIKELEQKYNLGGE